jgi:hypothetical protein
MLKDDERSRNVYENKGKSDNMPDKNPVSWSENASVLRQLTQIFGHSGKTCGDYETIQGKDGAGIGSSAHQSIGWTRSWF